MENKFPDNTSSEFNENGGMVDFNSPDVQKILEVTSLWEVPQERSKSEAWDMLKNSLEGESVENEAKVISLKRSWLWLTAAAACLALFFILSKPEPAELTTYEALAGNTTEVQLPDQSSVTLNADSRIQVNEEDWTDERTVLLIGEAFFDVEEGSVFSVKTEQGLVKVLGTSFNVYDRDNGYEVSCRSGKVQVEVNGSSVLLEKGERAVLVDYSSLSKEDISAENKASWTKGEFIFKNTSLISVLSELERQFDVTIEVSSPTVQEQLYTGFFSNQNVEEALSAICDPLGLTYKIQDGGKTVLIAD